MERSKSAAPSHPANLCPPGWPDDYDFSEPGCYYHRLKLGRDGTLESPTPVASRLARTQSHARPGRRVSPLHSATGRPVGVLLHTWTNELGHSPSEREGHNSDCPTRPQALLPTGRGSPRRRGRLLHELSWQTLISAVWHTRAANSNLTTLPTPTRQHPLLPTPTRQPCPLRLGNTPAANSNLATLPTPTRQHPCCQLRPDNLDHPAKRLVRLKGPEGTRRSKK